MAGSVERVYLFMLGIATGGATICYIAAGWLWAEGFLFGAALAAVNQWLLRWMMKGILAGTQSSSEPPAGAGNSRFAGAAAMLVGSRYLLLGAAGYVIVKVSGVSALSLLTGCFVALAALILEVIYERIYA